jgi:hypothetical protein
MRRQRVRLALAVVAAGATAALTLTAISLASAGNGESMTAVAAQATARFHDLSAAEAAGWNAVVKDTAGLTCIDNQPVGGMGVHYANGTYLTPTNTHVDPTQPQALVYAPGPSGQQRLAALEYIVFQDAWTAAGHAASDPPTLFGQPFALTPAPNRFGIPAFYSLHVWIWEHNSSGTFQPWNPRVHC